MTIPKQITPPVTALVLACFIVVAPVSVPNALSANSPGRSRDQDVSQAGATKSPHQYTPGSITNACGVIPYEGYEGWTNSGTSEWKCVDGARVYLVHEDYVSSRGAKAERLARLKGKAPAHKPWRIAQTEAVGDTTVVELDTPVSFGAEEATPSKWVIMRARGASIFLICGPDREHVMDFYQSRHGRDARK